MHIRIHTFKALHMFFKPFLLIAETKNNKTMEINTKENLSEALTAFTNKSIFHVLHFKCCLMVNVFQISTYMSDGNLKQASDCVTLTHSIIKAL